MSRQYAAIPLHVPFEMDTVRAMTQHNDCLYVATDGGKIHAISLKIDKNCNTTLGSQDSLRVKVEGYEISEIRSFPDQLLVHIKSKSGTPGPLLALHFKGTLIRVDDSTDCFAPNAFSQSKTIAIASEKRLIIKEYDGQTFSQKFSREFQEPALSVALSYPNVCMVTHSKLIILNLQTNAMTDVKTFGVSNPFVLARDSTSFFSYSSLSAMVVDLNLNADLVPVTFEVPCKDHTRCGPLMASMSDNTVTVYDFKHHKGIIHIDNCKKVATFDTSILLATNKDVYILKDMTEAFEHVSAGSIDTAASSLPNQSVDVISSLFEMIWNNGKQKDALSLLKLKEFEDGILDVLSIFDFIVFSPPHQSTGRLVSTKHTNNKTISAYLAEILLEVRSGVSEQTKISIDTAIIEIFSFLEDNKQLCDFFDTNPTFSRESLHEFFKDGHGVPYAVYLSSLGRKDEAVKALKESSSLDVAARVISKYASDWAFIQEHVPWLFERAPVQACLLLANDQIDISRARAYVMSQFPKYYLRFLMAALRHKDIISRRTFINELATGLIKLLISVKMPNFNREDAAFLTCMINDKNSSLEQIEKEVSDDLIDVLRTFHEDVDIQALMPHVNQIQISRVQTEIYTAAGCLNEALLIVWNKGFDECVQFCRECDEPQKAFSCLMKIIHEKSKNPVKDIITVINENVETVDIADALQYIDGEEDLSKVVDLISESYKILTSERRSREVAASFAESRAIEADYERAVLESGHISLGGDAVCAGCNKLLGSQYVVRTPNGLLYHYKCLAIQK